MKNSVAVLLLIGAISNTQQFQQAQAITQSSAGFLQADSDIHNSQQELADKANKQSAASAQEKALAAAAKAKQSWQKVQQLATKNKQDNGVTVTKLQKVDDKALKNRGEKPPTAEKLQVRSTMDVKTGNGLVVQVEAVKKPESANKLQELAAMEEALKKATDEAHRQRLALSGGAESEALNQQTESVQSKALTELKKQQEAQQQALLHQLDLEEKQRQAEIKQNEELENKIAQAEKERQQEEILSHTRAAELKKLQEEEAAQKLEAERMEQEFLAAQAVQETKAAAAKKAAAKANLARLKRKHELSRRKAEAQLQMLKVKQQMEAEQALELEKQRLLEDAANADSQKKMEEAQQAQASAQAQQEAAVKAQKEAAERKAEEDKRAAEQKAADEKARAEELKRAEAEKKRAEEQRAAEEKKKKAEALKLAQEQKVEAEKQKKHEKYEQLSEKMGKELDQFSVTLNKKHFDAAMAVRDEAKQGGLEDIPLRVHAGDIYKKSFTFPQIAHNDYAVEQFETLSIAEANLNNDPTNESNFEAFVKTADDVALNLKERYKDQWVDPKDDRGVNKKDDSE